MDTYLERFKKIHGDVIELTSPSGYKFVIRQQNGEDDDILSKATGIMDGSSAAEFVAAIVVDTDFTINKKLTKDDAMSLKLYDKYFIMLASRIFSIGQILKFEYNWGEVAIPYEEDLGLYIWDYGNEEKPFPKNPDDADYFKYRLIPHPHGKERDYEFTTSTGKLIKVDFTNGYSEKYLMMLPEEKQSKNQELFSRNIRLKLDDKWVKIETFKFFNPREMMEIRNKIESTDPVLEIFTEIEDPKSKKKILFPIFGSSDFFFPREI